MAAPLPKDSFPYFKGYSVGRWENGTLVFETVGLQPGVWLDAKAATASEDARLTEHRAKTPGMML